MAMIYSVLELSVVARHASWDPKNSSTQDSSLVTSPLRALSLNHTFRIRLAMTHPPSLSLEARVVHIRTTIFEHPR